MHTALPRICAAGLAAVFLALPWGGASAADSGSAAPPLMPAHRPEAQAAPAPAAPRPTPPVPATPAPAKPVPSTPSASADGPRIVTATHRWLMGSGETLADAKRMCRAEAVRRIVEQAGLVIESVSEVENFVLTRDQSRSYAAALVEVRSAEERLERAGEGMAVVCTVRALVDRSDLARGVRELQDDPGAARRAEDAWGRTERLAREERELRASSPQPGDPAWSALQDKRQALARSFDELRREKAAVLRSMEEETRRAAAAAEPGMTVSEIERLLGPPRAVLPENERGYACGRWGEVWVVFRHGVAECVRSRLQDRPGVGECQCDGLSTGIIKR